MKRSYLLPFSFLAAMSVVGAVYAFDPTAIDRSVSPTADFFDFANGAWLAKANIPPDKAGLGVSDELREQNDAILHTIAESAASDRSASPSSARGKVGLYYRVGMDEQRAESLGAKPIEPILHEIDAVSSKEQLAAEIARLQKIGVNAGFRGGAGADQKNSTAIIFSLRQGGLGLPNRETYLSDSARATALRKKYVDVTEKGFELVGDSPDAAATEANAVLDLETRLAKASSTPVQLRDIEANYNKTDVAGVEKMAPGFAWGTYFRELGKSDPGPVNVGQPKFFGEFSNAVDSVPMDTWHAYLRHQVIAEASPFLSKAFVDNQFRLSGSMRGVTEQQVRWKRVLASTNSALGEALGELYVQKAFSPEAKRQAHDLVVNLKGVLRDRIQQLDWMSPQTKREATVKLDAIMIKVGYPDKWRDYSKLEVRDDSFVQNMFRARQFEFNRNMAKIGKPVDRTEWGMTPQTVNAYYNASLNEIVFPAGILQPPFFDPKAPAAANYGSIGAVIGHEMTHGFDDHGRLFDAKGNWRDWWTADDEKNFKMRAEGLATQYDAYVVGEDTHLNGHLTLGENIADLGGLKIAYLAYKRATAGKPQPTIDGFTPDQQFFLAFAQSWREKRRPESEALSAATDPHSTARYRVLGTLQNTPEFWTAWGAQPPANTITIW